MIWLGRLAQAMQDHSAVFQGCQPPPLEPTWGYSPTLLCQDFPFLKTTTVPIVQPVVQILSTLHEERAGFVKAMLETRCCKPDVATNLTTLQDADVWAFCPGYQQNPGLNQGVKSIYLWLLSEWGHNKAALVRIQAFDLMLQRHAAPTLAKQAHLSTTKVLLPAMIHNAGRQLRNTSIVRDIVLGEGHVLSTLYCRFCHSTWPNIKGHLCSENNPTEILPLIHPWMHLELGDTHRVTVLCRAGLGHHKDKVPPASPIAAKYI